MSGSGGTKTKAAGYTIHTFSADDDFILAVDTACEWLIVGGGGGAGVGGEIIGFVA